MHSLLILKTGGARPEVRVHSGDYEDMFLKGLGRAKTTTTVCDLQKGDKPPPVTGVGAVVVTGSSAMVTAGEPWMLSGQEWLGSFFKTERPLLAVCFGHQLLARALGGVVGTNPGGREIGTIKVTFNDAAQNDPLFGLLPRNAEFQASHLESVLKVPEGATILGASALDPTQGLRLGRQAWSVQFHPEFSAAVVRGSITPKREQLIAEGLDPDELHENAKDSNYGTLLLRRFAEIVEASEARR